jgi:hypothetical protein
MIKMATKQNTSCGSPIDRSMQPSTRYFSNHRRRAPPFEEHDRNATTYRRGSPRDRSPMAAGSGRVAEEFAAGTTKRPHADKIARQHERGTTGTPPTVKSFGRLAQLVRARASHAHRFDGRMLEAVGSIQLLGCALCVVSGRLDSFSARGGTKRATRIFTTNVPN